MAEKIAVSRNADAYTYHFPDHEGGSLAAMRKWMTGDDYEWCLRLQSENHAIK